MTLGFKCENKKELINFKDGITIVLLDLQQDVDKIKIQN